MHICVVAGTFHPETGGPPTYLYYLLPELIRRGHTLEVITYTDSPHSSSEDKTYPYPVYRVSRQKPILLRLLTLTLRILRAGRRADVIFVSDYGLPAAIAGKTLHKPIVFKNVGDFAWEFSCRHGWLQSNISIDRFQTGKHALRVRLLQGLRSWYSQAATAVIVPSRYVERLVLKWGVDSNKTRLIYNALDLSEFGSLPDRATARTHLGLSPNVPLLLTVARLTPWKGIAGIIRALSQVRRIIPETQLLIVGDGQERPELEDIASDHRGAVHFLGMQPLEQVRKYIRAADAFVLFSTYEGLPHTLLEAMASETPVIASKVGGNVEVIEHECTGLLVPPEDIDALSSAICQLLSNQSIRQKFASAALDSLGRFSWEKLVDDTESVLCEVAK